MRNIRSFAATVPPRTEAFRMKERGFIPDLSNRERGHIVVTVDGSKRHKPTGTMLRDVPGCHSPLLYHDRTENTVQGMFTTLAGHTGAEALRRACETSVIEEFRNPLIAEFCDRAAEQVSNVGANFVKDFVRGVINETFTHRHVSSNTKNRYVIGACGNLSIMKVSSDYQGQHEDENYTLAHTAGMVFGLAVVSLDVSHSCEIAENQRYAVWFEYGGDPCAVPVFEPPIRGEIERDDALLTLPDFKHVLRYGRRPRKHA